MAATKSIKSVAVYLKRHKVKYILIFLTFIKILGANELLEQAKKFEEEGNYKEATLLYKKILTDQSIIQDETLKNKLCDSNISAKEEHLTKKSLGKHIKSAFKEVDDNTTNDSIEQMLSSKFDVYPYKENYFLPATYDLKHKNDRDQGEAKFQFSIKKPITDNLFGLDEVVYFGFTQKSWWQTYSKSAPFRETNYAPEIYILAPYKNKANSIFKAYKVGFLHESNGQSDDKSRSWNRVNLEGYLKISNLLIIPRIWMRIPEKNEDDDNPDIVDYLGYGDVNFLYTRKEHIFKLLLRNNFKLNKDNKGFTELNWSFPLFGINRSFALIQVSSGYGDSLIDYNKEIHKIGFGVSLSR